MVIKYLDSKRLEGVAGDLTATPVIGVGGWKEVGRTTLGSTTKPITVSSIANKRYYMFLIDMNKSGNATSNLRVGNGTIDGGNNYARRQSYNGASDGTAINVSTLEMATANAGVGDFIVGYITNLSNKEKLFQMHWMYNSATGAGTAPTRGEHVGKWANTSNVIDIIQLYNSQSGNYLSGSEVVVLGWDPADTHTDNFWEPLGSTTLATAGDNIEVTFTAKKYLMVKLYRKPTGSADARWTFNNDGGANYAKRKSSDGSTDSTSEGLNQNYFTQYTYDNNEPSYSSTIIVNTAGAEKLGTQHEMTPSSAGASAQVHRSESVFKWANTSDQITTIDITNSKSGSYDVGSIIEVWGHD